MKKVGALALIFIFCGMSMVAIEPEPITEAHYIEVDQKIWSDYESQMEQLRIEYQNNPTKRDSLTLVSKEILEIASKQNIDAAIKYATVPSGLQRLFMVRLSIPKYRLKSVVNALPDSVKGKSYYKSLQTHINNPQLEVGDKYIDLEFTKLSGEKMKLSSLDGKQILLIYGGLSCMGAEGVKYLNELYSKTDRKDFEIVVFCQCRALSDLKNVQETYKCPYPIVSDMTFDQSLLKIIYGAQSTPTCFIINKDGKLCYKNTGVHQSELDAVILGESK